MSIPAISVPLILTALFVYPIKSAQGIRLTESWIEKRGLRHDRRWLVVDPQGRQVTAREKPQLLQVRIQIMADHLDVQAPQMPPLRVPFVAVGAARRVQVWGDTMDSVEVNASSNTWFSEYLGGDFALVYMPDESERWQGGEGKTYSAQLSFADGNPFHLITEASLQALNTELVAPARIEQFRPNLVLGGDLPPYAEDFWRHITLGGTGFQVVESCDRCSMINLSPEGGRAGAEPLRTLAKVRRVGKKVPFGQHLILDGWAEGMRLQVGDTGTVDVVGETPNPMY